MPTLKPSSPSKSSGNTVTLEKPTDDDEKEPMSAGQRERLVGEAQGERTCWENFCTRLGLGCCVSEDAFKRNAIAEVVQNENRVCTDVPCLLFLIAVLVTEIILLAYADSNGADTAYLRNGVDFNGTICDGSGGAGKLAAWAGLEYTYQIKICVDSCSETQDESTGIVSLYPSDKFLRSWCVPTSDYLKNNATSYKFNSASQTWDRAIGDLDTAKWLILASTFIAIAFGFIYMYFMSLLARVFVCLALTIAIVGGAFLGSWLIKAGINDINDDNSKSTGQAELALGIIVWIILVCFVLALLWLRKRIIMAFHMLNEASRAVRDVKSTLLFPLFYSLVVMGFLALWILIALFLYSVKETETRDTPEDMLDAGWPYATYKHLKFDRSLKNAFALHCIILAYLFQLLAYFGFMVLAGTFADWYFSKWNDGYSHKVRGHDVAELSHMPVIESLLRVLRFHLGSLAFGALLITIVRVFRVWLTYIQKKTEAAQSPLIKCLFNCAQCLLKCCQCLIDTMNKEGFIFTTIYGTSICYSSMIAVKLIWRNVVRAAMVEGISHVLEKVGIICIAAATTGVSLVILNESPSFKSNLSSVLTPAIAIFIISYLIGILFMTVYECAIDTLFLCYLVDEEVHAPNGPRFAHKEFISAAKKSAQNLAQTQETKPV